MLHYNFVQKSEQNYFSIPKKPGFVINHLDKAIKDASNITKNQPSLTNCSDRKKHHLFFGFTLTHNNLSPIFSKIWDFEMSTCQEADTL